MSDGRAADVETTMPAEASATALPANPFAWPCRVPAQGPAEATIAAAVKANGDADTVVARVARELTEIEASAFDGISVADPALLKATAGMRLRLATALSTALDGVELDDEAAKQLLADADDLLKRLAEESSHANKLVRTALGAIRTDLVRDAIRVGETHQRLANPAVAAASVAAPAPAAPQVRVLSNEAGDARAAEDAPRRRIGIWVVLVIAIVAAGGYHVDRALQVRRADAERIRIDGVPDRVLVTPEGKGGQLLMTPPGSPLTQAEIDQIQAAQAARGRKVVSRAPGIYVLERVEDAR